jgi:release factor glutamine methyltransferase
VVSIPFATLRNELAERIRFLVDKPEETPESTLRALWLTAAGQPVSPQKAATVELSPLSDTQKELLRRLIEKRVSGVPLAHITGRQCFMDLEMLAGAEALVPRKETELLARAAIGKAAAIAAERGVCTIVDVCTGSGNVALSVAHHVTSAKLFAADLSEPALDLARRNAQHLGLEQRVEFRAGDLLQPFANESFLGRVDVLTCNPPYISSAGVERMPREISAHEPRLAFDGGPLGIGILMRLVREAPSFIRPGGWLAFEVGQGQGPGLLKRMQANAAFKEVLAVNDDSGAIRALTARL